MEDDILTVKDAAILAKASKNVIYRMIKSGQIRASYVGGWRLIRKDFLEDMRAFYNKKQVIDKYTQEKKWESIKERTESTGSFASRHQAEKEYTALLAQITKKTRKGCMTK